MDPVDVVLIADSNRGEVAPDAVANVPASDTQQRPVHTTGADPSLSVRPTYRRAASDVETIAASVIHEKTDATAASGVTPAAEHGCVAPTEADGASHDVYTYPPVLHESAIQLPLDHLDESKGLRMLRMGASFLTLFLAGWKSVDRRFMSLHRCIEH